MERNSCVSQPKKSWVLCSRQKEMQHTISPANSLSLSLSLSLSPSSLSLFGALPLSFYIAFIHAVDAVFPLIYAAILWMLFSWSYVPNCMYLYTIYHITTAYPGFEPRPGQVSWPKTRLAFLSFISFYFISFDSFFFMFYFVDFITYSRRTEIVVAFMLSRT